MPPSGTEAPSGSAACLVKGLRGRLELPRLRVILSPFPARRPRDVRERCVSPTSATDSVHEHLQIARFLAALPLRATPCDASWIACQLTLGRSPHGATGWVPPLRLPNEPPGGASLDGEIPSFDDVRGARVSPSALAQGSSCAVLRGPGGVTIVDPSALHLPAWTLFAFGRAREIVSDVLCRGAQRAGHRCPVPSPRAAEIRLPRALVKERALVGSRRLPSSECSLPLSRRTLSRLRVGSRGARHRVIARVLVALATTTRLPALLHCVCARASRHVRRAARPVVFRPGPYAARRLLQSNQPASTTAWTARLPPLSRGRARLACACARRRPRSASPSTGSIAWILREAEAPRFLPALPAEVHRPGAASTLVETALRRTTLASRSSTALPRPAPLGHLVS